ncbi:hypothetical protein NDU88_000766 [Pleurodeles waltl]|uniref:Uncharacterized protein n=1 Tax=Pleurodeles waltl TaxID=8319 RepID=A0AAV7WGF5_PLEWA|nr:hypothetical protein NDU88_000766 [Pleurodeles waltl]
MCPCLQHGIRSGEDRNKSGPVCASQTLGHFTFNCNKNPPWRASYVGDNDTDRHNKKDTRVFTGLRNATTQVGWMSARLVSRGYRKGKDMVGQSYLTTEPDTLSLDNTPAVCLLGFYHQPAPKKVGNRFADLVLALAKLRMVMAWKLHRGPSLETWVRAVRQWAWTEERALQREEARGNQGRPIVPQWIEVDNEWESPAAVDNPSGDEMVS